MKTGFDCHGVLGMPTTTKMFIGPWILNKAPTTLGNPFCCLLCKDVANQNSITPNFKHQNV